MKNLKIAFIAVLLLFAFTQNNYGQTITVNNNLHISGDPISADFFLDAPCNNVSFVSIGSGTSSTQSISSPCLLLSHRVSFTDNSCKPPVQIEETRYNGIGEPWIYERCDGVRIRVILVQDGSDLILNIDEI
jgi:hypothetical protein